MQIIEHSIFGVRSAKIKLTAESKPEFTLFPMVHIADRSFYEEVGLAADLHELVLGEGVKGKSMNSLLAYKKLARRDRNGLFLQKEFLNSDAFPHWRNVDIEATEFDRLFSGTPLKIRLMFRLLGPLAPYWYADRKSIMKLIESLDDTDFETRTMLKKENSLGPEMTGLVMDRRDEILAGHCDKAIAEQPSSVAVVWGAQHILRIMRHLLKIQGYRINSLSWQTVISAAW